MQKRFNKNDDAVSPVVAVMLMLVVTIIIAALVSAFASGLAESPGSTSNVILKGTYSQTTGLALQHLSGDTIQTADTTITVRPDKDFGNYDNMAWTLNKTTMFNNYSNINKDGTDRKNGAWAIPQGTFYTSSLVPEYAAGDYMYVNATNVQKQGDDGNPNWGTKTAETAAYSFTNENNAGKHIIVELQNNGKTIATTTIPITA